MRWKITFSKKKTQVVFFTPQPLTRRQSPPQHTLTLTGFPIDTTDTYTYLGVVLDAQLNFQSHLARLVQTTTGMSIRLARLVRRDKLPSFPVIRRLVQCVLVPQMTYAFAFLFGSIENKPVRVSTSDSTTTTRTNMYSKLKNNLLRPLRQSLALPFSAHHDSTFIESRLLNVDSLITCAAAQLVHRWLSMTPQDNNTAAVLFRQHVNIVTTLSPYHPCARMCTAIGVGAVPLLQFDPSNMYTFTIHPRPQIHQLIWQHQYESWQREYNTSSRLNSLPVHYPSQTVPLQLPVYLLSEHPAAASRRARLRFRRTDFAFNKERMGYNTPLTCTQCSAPVEDNEHVLCHCPVHDAARHTCTNALDALIPVAVGSSPHPMLPLSVDSLVAPERFLADRHSHLLTRVLTITSTFFKQIAATRSF